jgi:O-Antigen ligase
VSTVIQRSGVRRSSLSALGIGRALCVLTMVFASGDVWPVLNVGFTFRFAQLFALAALFVLLAVAPMVKVQQIAGARWMFAYCAWVFVTMPFSLYVERSFAYAFWTLADTLIIATFAHYFATPDDFRRLLRWFILSFNILALFGLLQFGLSLFGRDLFVAQWWIEGRLARINGLSYEPSYYATYMVPGWILSLYLLEKKAAGVNVRLVKACAWLSTAALILCTSRTGWMMMAAWLALRGGLFLWRTYLSGRLSTVAARRIGAGVVVCAVLTLTFGKTLLDHADDLSFLGAGIGLFGQTTTHSSDDRADAFLMTWRAFLEHPLVGTGVGAVPAEVSAQRGSIVMTLEDAKQNEGFSLVMEILASTGLIGGALLGMFWFHALGEFRIVCRRVSELDRYSLWAILWALIWLALSMFLNQNFLRLYIFVDIAVFVSGLVAFRRIASSPAEHQGA